MGLINVSEAYAADSLVAVQLPKTDLLVNEKIQFTKRVRCDKSTLVANKTYQNPMTRIWTHKSASAEMFSVHLKINNLN